MTATKQPAPPQISPYVFPVLLAGFGLWCFYDGWISIDPNMMKHQTFNRIASGVLLQMMLNSNGTLTPLTTLSRTPSLSLYTQPAWSSKSSALSKSCLYGFGGLSFGAIQDVG